MRSRFAPAAIVAALVCLGGSVSAAARPVGMSATVTVRAAADATISKAAPRANYGRERSLIVSGSPVLRSYLRFTIPNGTRTVGAKLRLFVLRGGGILTVRPASARWNERSVTFARAARTGLPAVRVRVPSRGGWLTVNAGRLVRSRIVSLALTTTSRRSMVLASRETNARAPQLVLQLEPPPPTEPPPPSIAAAGNIACDPASPSFNGGAGTDTECGMRRTSDLLVNAGLAAVLTMGDNQYPCGELEKFMTAFDPTWGRVKPLIRPALGNHDLECDFSGRARGYFSYFGAAAGEPGKGWYSFDIGAWHLIALMSECAAVGGCGPASPQGQWLAADLAAHRNRCTLAYWHYPRFASGIQGNQALVSPFWDALYAAGADVILNAHEHHYERFAPQNPAGQVDLLRGIREFIVGTGGRELHGFDTFAANSEVRLNTSWGVLKLTLRPTSYDWRFVPVAGGTAADSGSASCR
ncbi:MAG: DNRLRE domain-containing protein [Gaiellaceae bacterium]